MSTSIPRPRRWDLPFSCEPDGNPEMTDADVDRLMSIPPFCNLDADGFRRSLPLRGILKNDVRIVRFDDGDIIVRKGDWGSTAFFVLDGRVRVEIESPETSMPAAMLGRSEHKRKTLFQVVAQLWSNHPEPEFRSRLDPALDVRVATRGTGDKSRIYLQDVSAILDQYRTARIDAGQWFGELAALGRTPRVATVFAEGPAELLEIRWQGLRDIMRFDRNGSFKKFIEDVFRERALAAFLRNEPIFQDLNDEQMEQLVAQVEFETYGNYDSPEPFKDLANRGGASGLATEPIVRKEGDYPNGIVLIRSGLARLSQQHHHGHRTVGYLSPGQLYGYDEILQGWRDGTTVPLLHSLRAIGYLNIVVVPTVLVEQFLLEDRAKGGSAFGQQAVHTQPTARAEMEPEPALEPLERRVPAADQDHLLDFLVDYRYVQGTATMIIDLDRCTRCDDCVRACASTHDGNPRFIRHGPSYGGYMVANACMHCADPVCMIECPTGAIHRDQSVGQIVINEQTCIGCAQCANNCPFDAIRMTEIREADGQFIVDQKSGKPLIQATKCDLCIDQLSGPACQSACPHDALHRIDMRDSELLRKVFVR